MDSSYSGGRERELRLRFPVALMILFWVSVAIAAPIEKPYFHSFIFQLISSSLFLLLFLGWWLFNRGLSFKEKAFGLFGFVLIAAVTGKLMDRSVNPFVMFRFGAPIAGTVTIFWLLHARGKEMKLVGVRLAALVALSWSPILLLRSNGTDSALATSYSWRWTASQEEKFLSGYSRPVVRTNAAETVTASEKEWGSFRGPNRDGVALGTSISTNWAANPPQLVWKKAVGPAWSSVVVAGRRLFTQEQRGAMETVVCYEAETGAELWTHEDETRFDEPLSGIGPRGTPALAGGRLYTLGATGLLNCLDAATGKRIWKRETLGDAEAKTAQWGISSSPFIHDGKVYVYAGGPKGLLAYRAEEGELVWAVNAGESSYCSPQIAEVAGVPHVLMLHDFGLTGHEVATGRRFWETGLVFKGGPRSNQPRHVKDNQFLIGGLNGAGTSYIKIANDAGKWTVTTNWISKDLKPEFPDFVVFENHVYGFDVSMFCCIGLADGKRAWKDGRYGRGQVILLKDQALLLVASEQGELILLAADPTAHRELGRLKALDGKTWNGPVVRGDLVFHRNAQEMACYRAANMAPPKTAAR